jgi:glutamine---fructose-6-phosphate transaminase (isomerizing)
MQSEKGKFTQQEILSQPSTWMETLKYLQADWEDKLPVLQNYDQIIITGCGSTYYFSIWASRFLQQNTGISCMALPSSEIWYSGESWLRPYRNTLVIAVSRSGLTTETLHAVEYYKQTKKGDVAVITCYEDSPLAKMSPITFATTAGKEQSIAQTRSFTNMMWPIIYLSERNVADALIEKIGQTSQQLIDKYRSIAQEIGRNSEITKFFFLGNGALHGLSQEVMLKIKEMSLSHSEAFHFLEFRHGPMSMVNKNALVVGFNDPSLKEYEFPVMADMKKLGGCTLAVGAYESSPSFADYVFNIGKEIPQKWSYPLYLPLMQLIAYERSISKGLDPDNPENLSAVVEL